VDPDRAGKPQMSDAAVGRRVRRTDRAMFSSDLKEVDAAIKWFLSSAAPPRI
jgi:hypothetical protein